MGWLIAGLILFTLMVLAEKALLAITPHELDMLRAEGTPSARRVVTLADAHNRRALAAVSLARILIWVAMVIGVLNVLFRMPMLSNVVEHMEDQYGVSHDFTQPIVALVVVGVLAFVLWRISRMDLRRTQRPVAAFWLQRLSWFITGAIWILKPFLPKKQKNAEPAPATPDTDMPAPQDAGQRDLEILKSIAKFGDVTVKQVMQPQSKIVALDKNLPFGEVLHTVRATDFSRLPVYEEDLDNVIGTLYVKDIVNAIDAPSDFDWVQRLRPEVFIVPETKPISEVFREFKKRKLHLAIVVDEYGGTAGLVTMEDILEEITGEIRDEFDEENEIPPFNQLDHHTFLFAGTTMINDVCHIAGLDPETFEEVREDADTIAGLVLNLMGEIPATGAQTEWGQYRFLIEKADNRRIEKVRLEIMDSPESV